MIKLSNIKKTYRQGDSIIEVLKDVSLTINSGEKVAIVGASGSGKSTLLSLMSGMDIPDSGTIEIDGEDISKMDEKRLSELRNKKIAIIFQSFELVPSFTALENVMLPLNIASQEGRNEAMEALGLVGLSHRINHLPSMLSGGEEQRVAIARALAQKPSILFADEPTGNLDQRTGKEILALIENAAADRIRTLVVITHDPSIAARMDRVLEIAGGSVSQKSP